MWFFFQFSKISWNNLENKLKEVKNIFSKVKYYRILKILENIKGRITQNEKQKIQSISMSQSDVNLSSSQKIILTIKRNSKNLVDTFISQQ